MSFWSAIGLADRKSLENLMTQLQELRDENQKLRAENQKLFEENRIMIFQQMQNQQEQMMQKQMMGFSNIQQEMYGNHSQNKKEFQLFEEMFKQLKNGQDMIRTSNRAQGDSIQDRIIRVEESAGHYYDELVAGIELLQKGQEKITLGVDGQQQFLSEDRKRQEETIQKGMSRMTDSLSASNKDLAKRVEDVEKKITDAVSSGGVELYSYLGKMEKSQDAVLRNMSEQFDSITKEFRDTRVHYKKMVHSEEQWLDHLGKLYNNFVELHREQSKVMEYLSQICQNSEQFMEIQKSINDMWEIMKVVWVDSLLDGYGE